MHDDHAKLKEDRRELTKAKQEDHTFQPDMSLVKGTSAYKNAQGACAAADIAPDRPAPPHNKEITAIGSRARGTRKLNHSTYARDRRPPAHLGWPGLRLPRSHQGCG